MTSFSTSFVWRKNNWKLIFPYFDDSRTTCVFDFIVFQLLFLSVSLISNSAHKKRSNTKFPFFTIYALFSTASVSTYFGSIGISYMRTVHTHKCSKHRVANTHAGRQYTHMSYIYTFETYRNVWEDMCRRMYSIRLMSNAIFIYFSRNVNETATI